MVSGLVFFGLSFQFSVFDSRVWVLGFRVGVPCAAWMNLA